VTLLFAFGLIFELPVFIFFLTSLGLVSTKALRKFRRWAILLSFIVAAVLTPTPDAVNQLLMAGPMCILYEIGIWVSWFVDHSRLEEKARKAQAEAEAAEAKTTTPSDDAKPADAAQSQPAAGGDDAPKAG
jgi:sec-independent protein translocase protein TatC